MTCDELRDDYDFYALGFDDEPESSEIRAHLLRNCPNCVPGVAGSLALVGRMAALAQPVEPPARLRKRILAAVNPSLLEERPRSRFGWSLVWGAASAILLAVAVLLGAQARHLGELRRAETARLEAALAVMSAPDSQDVTFGTSRDLPPRGRVVINRRRGVVLIASNLPQVSAGKAFELWLIPKGSAPLARGVFRAGSDGTGLAIWNGPIPENLAVVAVTVEDEAGVSAPTTKPIIAATAAAGA